MKDSTTKIVCVSGKMLLGSPYVMGKHRTIIDQWIQAISTQVRLASRHAIKEDPLHIIKVRYAKGEITKEQYEEMKKTIES